MKNLIPLAIALTTLSQAFAYELYCDKLIDIKTRVTADSRNLKFETKENTIHDEGMRALLREAGVPATHANEAYNINVSFKTDAECELKNTLAVPIQCAAGQTEVLLEIQKYKYSNEEFTKYKLNVDSVKLSTQKSKVEGHTMVSVNLELVTANGTKVRIPQKYHLYKVELGHSARCWLNEEFEIN